MPVVLEGDGQQKGQAGPEVVDETHLQHLRPVRRQPDGEAVASGVGDEQRPAPPEVLPGQVPDYAVNLISI